MPKLETAHLAVTEGLHRGVEPTGGEVVDTLFDDPLPGVCPIRHMHPKAVRTGKRFMAAKELGAHFTRYVQTADLAELDEDQVAARTFMDAPFPSFWLGIDPHDSPTPNANSLVVSERFTTTMIAVAPVMELDKVIVLPGYPFLNFNEEFVSVETERAPATNRLSQPGFWRECLAKMVDLGPDGMDKLGREVYGDLKYYCKAELRRIDDNGKPDPRAIERIRKLEGVPPPGPHFTPFEPSHPIFTPALRQYEGRLCVGTWDDHNHSPELPALGLRDDGRPRRLVFGSFLLRLTPPELAAHP